ncbi:MAG: VanZ family protein, partial [Deltaproteobacteria bacterium]|nr:VanZ family protein [Deltaproteobacteria bacterium]
MGSGREISSFNFFRRSLKVDKLVREKSQIRARGNVLVGSRKIYFLLGLAYLGFVIYGSLVPLDFRPRPFDVALRDFYNIRYLKLGAASRADWVANILLYIPLAYLWLGALARDGKVFSQTFCSVIVFCFCVALSVAIEFTQQFFPPRTVSLNDLIAELLGTSAGILLWWTSGRRLRRLFELVTARGRNAAYAGSILYTSAYLVFSLFPFDFLISAQEIERKLAGDYVSLMPSSARCGDGLRCGVKMMAEAVAVAPLGFLLSLLSRSGGWPLIKSGAWIGFWLGIVIEGLQLFLASGSTLVASIATRIVGVAGGATAGVWLGRVSPWPMLYLLAPSMPAAGMLYAALLFAVTLLGKGPVLSVDRALERLSEIYFMPFYYHYYTSESAAMSSLIGVASMFLPIGLLF